ncbi:MAG: flagellar basal body L-ring protein [Rickettsiales bacterium]|nr:flagellar basal body L-ring protein [Rickettsiales bacterium]
MQKTTTYITIALAALTLSACSQKIDKLSNIGKAPPLAQVENPHVRPDYKPLTWPLPDPEPESAKYANSLWQPGARAFFRDQRAARVGDILRVRVEINDKAEVDNETLLERSTNENVPMPTVGWIGSKFLPSGENLFSVNTSADNEGIGEIEREEKITTQVAAIVTQILPNGNMVIDGSQEIQVNFEVREIGIKGVIRPEDIESDNTIDSSKIAEARITYGGRGQLSERQQPRWGTQAIDIISPF